jgi:hypothetical protein
MRHPHPYMTASGRPVHMRDQLPHALQRDAHRRFWLPIRNAVIVAGLLGAGAVIGWFS